MYEEPLSLAVWSRAHTTYLTLQVSFFYPCKCAPHDTPRNMHPSWDLSLGFQLQVKKAGLKPLQRVLRNNRDEPHLWTVLGPWHLVH